MKEFNIIIDETLNVKDLDELEAAADLFHYGLESSYYTKKQATEFNNVYWKLKNRFLAYECAVDIKGSQLDIINIVASAPSDIKDDKQKLNNYVKNRMKAIKGNAKEKF
jgi:hypothetical protein